MLILLFLGHKALKEILDQLVQKDHKVLLVLILLFLGLKDHKEKKVTKENQGLLEHRVHQAQKEIREILEPKVFQ